MRIMIDKKSKNHFASISSHVDYDSNRKEIIELPKKVSSHKRQLTE